jgi:hypothetical protein
VRLALKAVVLNDGDFVNLILVIHAGVPGEEFVRTGTIGRHGRDGAMLPAAG